jgi:hypothetical protein
MPPPHVEIVPPGTNGGLFGAIAAKFNARSDLLQVFGENAQPGTARVHPGQVPPGTKLPFVTLSLVSARSEYGAASDVNGQVIYLNIWYTTFQVLTFAVGYESAREYAKLAHRHIDRKVFVVDCNECIPYVGNLLAVLDPKRSEDGREVWHFSYRYDVKLAEFQSWEDDGDTDQGGVANQGGAL